MAPCVFVIIWIHSRLNPKLHGLPCCHFTETAAAAPCCTCIDSQLRRSDPDSSTDQGRDPLAFFPPTWSALMTTRPQSSGVLFLLNDSQSSVFFSWGIRDSLKLLPHPESLNLSPFPFPQRMMYNRRAKRTKRLANYLAFLRDLLHRTWLAFSNQEKLRLTVHLWRTITKASRSCHNHCLDFAFPRCCYDWQHTQEFPRGPKTTRRK